MCTDSEGSGETEHRCRLALAFAGCLCDKYHNLMSWLIYNMEIIFIPFPFHLFCKLSAPNEAQTSLYNKVISVLRKHFSPVQGKRTSEFSIVWSTIRQTGMGSHPAGAQPFFITQCI